MESAPIISIFLSSGGPPVARGVLIRGQNQRAGGLFSPWPRSLTNDVKFSVYVPDAVGSAGKWFPPHEVGILEGVDEKDGTLGVVSFDPIQPDQPGSTGSIDQETFDEIEKAPNGSRWAALKAARGDDLKRLAELESSAATTQDTLARPEAAKPQNTFTVMAANLEPGDFFCRYLLRWD